jgi:hypothetical protein
LIVRANPTGVRRAGTDRPHGRRARDLQLGRRRPSHSELPVGVRPPTEGDGVSGNGAGV